MQLRGSQSTTESHLRFVNREQARAKALAIYREGRNAEQNYLVTYAVLSYYKIVELKHRGKSKARSWFETNYARLKDDRTLRTLNVMAEQSSA